MTKIILFDFWGTLVENGVWSPIKQVRNILGIRIPFSEYVVRMERAMMIKKYSNLREAFEAVSGEFSIPIDNYKIEKLVGLWNKSWMLAQPYPEVKEILTKLKKKYKLVLVSNTDPFSIENVLEKFDLKGLFDQNFLSYQIGQIKSDPEFFKQILKELNVDKEDCVMVGDSIQSDIIPAKRLEIKAILVDRRNSRDYHPKIKNLQELEKVLSI
ncbi:MAG: HAD family hydrolase [archaeon]